MTGDRERRHRSASHRAGDSCDRSIATPCGAHSVPCFLRLHWTGGIPRSYRFGFSQRSASENQAHDPSGRAGRVGPDLSPREGTNSKGLKFARALALRPMEVVLRLALALRRALAAVKHCGR